MDKPDRPATPALVEVECVTRYYGTRVAVSEVSFEMRRGEVLGFLGPNGAGKSTTMQMITGNLAPSAGRIRINGIDIIESPRAAKAELGYLPEQPPLYREFSVDEFLRFCARLHRMPRAQVGAAVTRAKVRCGLTEMGARLIGNLSKGYQQRVGIAQAILHTPKVVILDEPTVGLDPIQIREIRALIRELAAEHSVILSTHILPEVQAVCDRVQIMHKGELVMSDTIAGLTQRMQALSLRAAFRRPPSARELEALPGVAAAEALDGGRFRLHHAREQSPAEALVAAAVAGEWGLYELTPEHLSLEEIFVDITRTEPAATQAEDSAA